MGLGTLEICSLNVTECLPSTTVIKFSLADVQEQLAKVGANFILKSHVKIWGMAAPQLFSEGLISDCKMGETWTGMCFW